MTFSPAQGPIAAEGVHLVLYDGVCGLCNRLLQFLLKHDHRGVFSFASLQSAPGRAIVKRFSGNADDLTSFCVLTNYRTEHAQILNKSDAAVFVAGELRWPWKIAALARFVPTAIRDGIYDVVARTRYRLFGRLDACLVPQPQFRRRFIED